MAGRSFHVGTGVDFALARYNANGSLDTTFDGDGKLTTDFSDFDFPTGLALQTDGRIVVAGQSSQFGAGGHIAFARFNANGSLDNTFDGDGKLTTDFGSADDWAWRVAIQGDGKIVVAGGFYQESTGSDFALARYNSDGSLDNTFDGDGKLTTDFGSVDEDCTGLALQVDGKIVVAGYSNQGSTGYDFAIARYHGSTDTDTDGIADAVDTQPTIFSNDFSDGTTTGTITSRGGQVLTIVDAPSPAQGVVITAELSDDLNPAEVNVCDGASIHWLTPGDQVIATCGSVILDVRAGSIEAAFLADSGQQSTASIPTGNVLTFEPQTGTFSAPVTNPDTIVVVIGGMEMSITPGATFQPVQIDIRPSVNLANQGLIAVSILTTADFDAALVDVSSVHFAAHRRCKASFKTWTATATSTLCSTSAPRTPPCGHCMSNSSPTTWTATAFSIRITRWPRFR